MKTIDSKALSLISGGEGPVDGVIVNPVFSWGNPDLWDNPAPWNSNDNDTHAMPYVQGKVWDSATNQYVDKIFQIHSLFPFDQK